MSVRSRCYIAWFRLTRRKTVFEDTSVFDRSITDSQRASTSRPPKSLYRHHHVRRSDLRGFPCVTIAPRNHEHQHHVLYLHGGAYVHSVERSHWLFVGRLVERLGCAVTVPVYPLAPDYDCDSTVSLVEESHDRFLSDVDPARRVVMGDSAGGGLALVLGQRLRDRGVEVPAHLVLLSPWLDVSMTDPAIPTLDRIDPYLSTPGLIEAGRMYAGRRPVSDPIVSPLNGDCRGLGHISVFAGTRDVLLLDARRLQRLSDEQHFSLEYHEYKGMFHGWMLENIPEGRRVVEQIASVLGA